MATETEDLSDECPVACFFKLILQPRLDLHKLVIPWNFMKTHGRDLSKVVYLTIPSGKVWKFELQKENGRTLLQKGWPEFVEFYSLSHGHLLVFKYHGNSRFNVIICDLTASEIDYPCDHDVEHEDHEHDQDHGHGHGHHQVDEIDFIYDDDEDDDNDDDSGVWREKLPSQRVTVDDKLPYQSLSNKGKEVSTDEDDKCEVSTGEDDKCDVIFGKQTGLTPKAKKTVKTYARELKHPTFATRISSTTTKQCQLAIPNEFVRRYLGIDDITETCSYESFKLTTNDFESIKCWPVKLLGGASYSSMRIGNGWKHFAFDNKIKEGDICIFELINETEFKVCIMRNEL